MWNKIMSKILEKKNKNNPNIHRNCIWWRSEADYNLPIKKHKRYCSGCEKYAYAYSICDNFSQELFEATENSTSTKEYDLNINLEIEKDRIEGNTNDTGNEQRRF